jgi:hypothetical protein
MIGTVFNPSNCCFLSSQALNSNQFDPNVPDTGNLTTHNLLWDFVANTFIWVDTKTNLIVKELGGVSKQIAGFLNQSSTSEPEFSEVSNNTGYTINTFYTSPGSYTLEVDGLKPDEKILILTQSVSSVSGGKIETINLSNDGLSNIINIRSYSDTFLVNDIITNMSFKIEIYKIAI